jgi:uncharacterized protein (TIGR00255 family)
MIKSMTGFGSQVISQDGYQISCEVRGVNHRYFDINIRTSRRYNVLEDRLKEEVKKYVTRGRIEISINIEKTGDCERTIKVDNALVMAYYNSLKDLAEKLNISQNIKIIDLFKLPEVFSLEDVKEDIDLLWSVVQKAVSEAMLGFTEMRTREGCNLAKDISRRSDMVLAMVEQLEKRSPIVSMEYREKLRNRLSEYIPGDMVDEQRILQEVAIFTDKASVTEELVRLRSHLNQLEYLLQSNEAVGRKCDFLVQEMFREINTVGSKSNDLEMNKIVVEVKSELEKIREQLQNIE